LHKYDCCFLSSVDEGAHSRYEENMVEVLFQGTLVLSEYEGRRFFSVPVCYNVPPTFNIEFEIKKEGMIFYSD